MDGKGGEPSVQNVAAEKERLGNATAGAKNPMGPLQMAYRAFAPVVGAGRSSSKGGRRAR